MWVIKKLTLINESNGAAIPLIYPMLMYLRSGFSPGKLPIHCRILLEGAPYECRYVRRALERTRCAERQNEHGISIGLAKQFSAKPAEIRQFLRGELNTTRTQELAQQMLAAGLPL